MKGLWDSQGTNHLFDFKTGFEIRRENEEASSKQKKNGTLHPFIVPFEGNAVHGSILQNKTKNV